MNSVVLRIRELLYILYPMQPRMQLYVGTLSILLKRFSISQYYKIVGSHIFFLTQFLFCLHKFI